MKRKAARIVLALTVGALLLGSAFLLWRGASPGTGTAALPALDALTVTPGTGAVRRPPPPAALAWIPAAETAPGKIDLNNAPRKIPAEIIESYLERNGRSAASLMAAVVVADEDEAYLREAAQKHPNNPLVQFTLLYKNLFPEQRRQWLDRFMESSPDNALPAYLSAREHLKAGDTAGALRDLQEAAKRARYNDYSLETMLEVEQLCMHSGSSVLQAKVDAMVTVPMPQLVQFKQLGQEMINLREQYLTAGDPASARAMEQMILGLADHLTTGEGSRFLIGQLVGVAIERQLLEQLPSGVFSDVLGMTPAQRAEQLSAWRTALKGNVPDLEVLLNQASEAEAISYFDRLKNVGELEAMSWWQTRRGKQ